MIPADSARPLQGIRVLDLTQNVAGPYATMILADLGARVTKVEHPRRGDDTRHWGPPFWPNGDSPVFLALNRNKESLSLNLKEPAAREILRRLVETSDVLVESFRPGVMDRLGFGYEWACSVNPSLVYVSITAYGVTGPLQDRPGYDPLMQAYGGIMSVTGEPGRPPVRVGCSIVDMGTGMWAALATLTALYRRRETGRGERVVTSLYETSLAWMTVHLSNYWATGEVPGPLGSGTVGIVPYRAYPVRDGHVIIAAGNDQLFQRLSEVMGHPEWADDPRFARNPDRVRNREIVDGMVAAAAREWQSAELLAALAANGIPCSPIRTVDEVVTDEQALALGMFQPFAAGVPSGYQAVRLPVTFGQSRPEMRQAPARLGEHNAEVLGRLGYSPAEVQALLGGPVTRAQE